MKTVYSIFIHTFDYIQPALQRQKISVTAEVSGFPAMRATSEPGPMHGSFIGMTDEEFLATDLGSALAAQAVDKLQIKWNELLESMEEGVA